MQHCKSHTQKQYPTNQPNRFPPSLFFCVRVSHSVGSNSFGGNTLSADTWTHIGMNAMCNLTGYTFSVRLNFKLNDCHDKRWDHRFFTQVKHSPIRIYTSNIDFNILADLHVLEWLSTRKQMCLILMHSSPSTCYLCTFQFSLTTQQTEAFKRGFNCHNIQKYRRV